MKIELDTQERLYIAAWAQSKMDALSRNKPKAMTPAEQALTVAFFCGIRDKVALQAKEFKV
jgi:hypothetical protein